VKSRESLLFGERIRQLRERKGLSQAGFAQLCGFTNRVTLTNYEAGTKRPDLRLLVNIARACGVTLDWVLTGEEDKDAIPRRVAALVREAPLVYQSLLDEVAGDPRLLRAVQDLIVVVQGPDQQAAEWLLGNITVFAERARGQSRKRKRREAG